MFGALSDRISSAVLEADLDVPVAGRYKTALNGDLFLKAWHLVFRDGRYRSHDWTIKVDSDAVIVPVRLRQLLRRHCRVEACAPKLLANFGRDLHGAVEALSRGAVDLYAEGVGRCVVEIGCSDKGEDWFLSLCLDLIGVRMESEPGLLSGRHDDHRSDCDAVHAAFQPFRTWAEHRRCLCQTGFDSPVCDSPEPAREAPAVGEPGAQATAAPVTASTTSEAGSVIRATQVATTTPGLPAATPGAAATTSAPWISWLQEGAPRRERERGLMRGVGVVLPRPRPRPPPTNGGAVAPPGTALGLAAAAALTALAALAGCHLRRTSEPSALRAAQARELTAGGSYQAAPPERGCWPVVEEPAE
ncbi:unnamed protein product [Prorocentrum cordatum]|nr:unnamed protein product [Polarella glacialis]